ncbi:MAG TPA: CheR family methyltransferase [Acidimicrobiia bacterium]|nr:CheR family methyltransferase [Acidimicrobiia bacterium]
MAEGALAPLARVAADLLGADLGPARNADLARAAQAARAADRPGGGPLDDARLARRLRTAAPDDPVRQAFVEALTISETHLFRIRGQFDALAERVLPSLVVARRRTRRLRLWSAGCSTGEEAWTLAILLERLLPPGWDATVLGTDVAERALAQARRGVYGARSFRQTPESVRARWFTPAGDRWEVDPALRRRVRFAPLNLATDDYPSFENGTAGLDVVLCRHVLVYFSPEARARTAARLARCLAPGGWLAVAPAELSAAEFPGLEVRHFPAAILHQRPDPAAERSGSPVPGPPTAAVRRAPGAPATPPRAPTPETAEAETARRAADRLAGARAAADRGEGPAARRLADAALDADPLLAPARELRAHLLLEDGDDEGAEGELRAALFLDPARPVAHAMLGALLARRGERSRAAAAAAEVRRLLAGRSAGETVPGEGEVTVGRLLADVEAWAGPAGGARR